MLPETSPTPTSTGDSTGEPPPAAETPSAAPVAGDPPPSRAARFLEWLPVVIVAPFLILFLSTVMPRLGAPYELEWNEGQTAEQAWRFAKGLPLYPTPSEGWVPYMYAPLYHITYGALMRVTGVYTLGLGRIISFLSTIATAMGLIMIVYDRSRRLAPALLACLLFFAYFKPSGYWYDIVRVDAMAFALATWGIYLTLKKRVAFWQGALGLVLLMLGTLTKQTIAPIALYCALVLVWKNPRALLTGGFLVAMASANFLYIFQRAGNEEFFTYAVTNALKHPVATEVYFPDGLSPQAFRAKVNAAMEASASAPATAEVAPGPPPEKKNAGWGDNVRVYREIWSKGKAPAIWTDCIRHVWLLLLVVAAWIPVAVWRARKSDDWLYILPAAFLVWGGIEGYAKYGGYINNFVPVFLAVSLVTALSYAGFSARRRALVGGLYGLVIFLQVFQPWSIAAVTDGPANYQNVGRVQEQKRVELLWAYINRLKARAGEGTETPEQAAREIPFTIKLRYQLGRFIQPGLAWIPAHQWPASSSEIVYTEMMKWLAEKRAANEDVWIVHHQWYALLAGHPPAMNPDMVRCAQWAGNPYPRELSAPVDDRLFNWIVIDTQSIQYDWIPAELRASIEKHYEPDGQLPFFDQATRPRALVPVTGAEKWPIYLWKIKTPGGKRPTAASTTAPTPAPPEEESLLTNAEDAETTESAGDQ